jgi:hypothetical protein
VQFEDPYRRGLFVSIYRMRLQRSRVLDLRWAAGLEIYRATVASAIEAQLLAAAEMN